MARAIVERRRKHSELVDALTELWANPSLRLEKVSSSEPALLASLKNASGEAGGDTDDSRSELSVGSKYSYQSFRSNASYRSNFSTSSRTSTISVLSTSSNVSTYSRTSEFSIGGLDHRRGAKRLLMRSTVYLRITLSLLRPLFLTILITL